MIDPKATVRPVAAAVAALALSVALVACGGAESTSPGTGPHGGHDSSQTEGSEMMSADARFAMMMIPHHQQAVEMSDMLLAKEGVDERVADLAERIKAAQGPEIQQMEDWLGAAGIDGADMGAGHDDMGHGGMMSESDMAALEEADGPEASRLFLEQMIEHHEGAIDMAEEQLDEGEDPEMLALAETIVSSQSAEIAEMRDLLTEL